MQMLNKSYWTQLILLKIGGIRGRLSLHCEGHHGRYRALTYSCYGAHRSQVVQQQFERLSNGLDWSNTVQQNFLQPRKRSLSARTPTVATSYLGY